MNTKAIVYVKGFTKKGAELHLEPVKEYCFKNELEIVEVLFDETAHNERDLDCLKTLYEYMIAKKVSTIIFTSCFPFDYMRKYIIQFKVFLEYEILNFKNGVLDNNMKNYFIDGEELVFNQSDFDNALSVDFGNLVEDLSKYRSDLRFIDREQNARLIEEKKWSKQKEERDFRRNKGILGIVFNERNMSRMSKHVTSELFIDKAEFTDVVAYYDHDLVEVLSSKNYYKVIFDNLENDDIEYLRELIILCHEYVGEVQFYYGELSSKGEYELAGLLDELTRNA